MGSSPFAELFAPHERGLPAVQQLAGALADLERAPELGARVEALERLADWLRTTDAALPWPAGEADPAGGDARYRRLGVLAIVVERSPATRAAISAALREALTQGDALALFAETGIPEERGLFEEALERAQRHVLPAPREERDLGRLLARALPDQDAAAWLEGAPNALLARLFAALDLPDGTWTNVREATADALRLLASRAESIGLARAMRERRTGTTVRASPWYRLPRRTEALLARWERPADDGLAETESAWRATIAEAHAENREVLEHLESTGISVDLVFAIEAATRMLDRMSILASSRLAPAGRERFEAGVRVAAILSRERARAGSIRALFVDTSRQLARRVVERAGASGEHYIANGPREYAAMWASAAWGGVVTTGTAAVKISIATAHLPALPTGLLAGLNYAASFTLLQATHGTLATKQPSMTAAALAGILDAPDARDRAEELTDFVARITRSQLAAALGNVAAVAAGAFLFDRLWLALHGAHFVTLEKAGSILDQMHATESATWWYAASTGVILWSASLLAGSIENWSAYRRVPRAIAEHPLGARVGRERMQRLAHGFARNVSAYAGSVVLGFFLGIAPAIGTFTGLPIDVRHVTLSTGQVAFAACALGTAFDARVGFALGGVALMFVLNLSVSFALALWVAMRARGVGRGERRALLVAVLRRLRRRPLEFVVPLHRPTPAGGA